VATKPVKSTGTSQAEYDKRAKEQEKKVQAALDALYGVKIPVDAAKPAAPKSAATPTAIKNNKDRTSQIISQSGDSAEAIEKMQDKYKKKK
jgi:hypothetical protein